MNTEEIIFSKKIKTVFSISVFLFFSASLYIFSRFTVDDAFITWRYGKNLIDFGVWNYNPSSIDMTQAYTNPIYAILSIIPNYFGWDVVFYFKIFSSILLIAFLIWGFKKFRCSWSMAVIFLALPATIVHAYSGLETFLFVYLMAVFMVALYEEKKWLAIASTLFLFITRPETWLLSILLPFYYLIDEPKASSDTPLIMPFTDFSKVHIRVVQAIYVTLCLAMPLSIYFIYHKLHFGSALPNTFYVKSGSSFHLFAFIQYLFFMLPLFFLLYFKKNKLLLLLVAMFGSMAVSYSTSSLMMNYSNRFAFHIFAPVFIFIVYLSTKIEGCFYISTKNDFSEVNLIPRRLAFNGLVFGFLLAFAIVSQLSSSAHMATYYPRALSSHAALGKLLNDVSTKYKINAFSCGDAGMIAYHSKINALDNIGLGSSSIAKGGVTNELLDNYGIDLVIFHSRPGSIRLADYYQQEIFDWATKNGFNELCDVYWQKDYTMRIYSKTQIEEIIDLCNKSKVANNRTNREMFEESIISPPRRFWHE